MLQGEQEARLQGGVMRAAEALGQHLDGLLQVLSSLLIAPQPEEGFAREHQHGPDRRVRGVVPFGEDGASPFGHRERLGGGALGEKELGLRLEDAGLTGRGLGLRDRGDEVCQGGLSRRVVETDGRSDAEDFDAPCLLGAGGKGGRILGQEGVLAPLEPQLAADLRDGRVGEGLGQEVEQDVGACEIALSEEEPCELSNHLRTNFLHVSCDVPRQLIQCRN